MFALTKIFNFKRKHAPVPPPIPEMLPLYSLSEAEAAVVFILIFAATCAAAWQLLPGIAAAKRAFPRSFTVFCVVLGLFYTANGMKHFEDPGLGFALRSIVPPWGTWHLWYVPFSADFHVRWTGACEVIGGVLLLSGICLRQFGRVEVPAWVAVQGARLLFATTFCVTPANIYMITHGALLPGFTDEQVKDGKPLSATILGIRQTMQVLLLATLYFVGELPQKLDTKTAKGVTQKVSKAS